MPPTRRAFLESATLSAIGVALTPRRTAAQAAGRGGVRLQLVRNATCVIEYAGQALLLDPWLSEAGAMAAINNTPNPRPNPLVPLPVTPAQLVARTAATLLTHTHFDHWDAVARDALPKMRPIFVQPADVAKVTEAGFTAVRSVEPSLTWEGITITRTGGQHGRGAVGQRMGAVSGYILSHRDAPTTYIVGDSIWCPEVAAAIRTYAPAIIVVNAGEAQFLEGGPIIMGVADVVEVCQAAPRATVVAVHLEAVNHCVLTRGALRAGVTAAGVSSRVRIPDDGEVVAVTA